MTCLSYRISRLRDANGEITINFKEELEKWSLESKYCTYYTVIPLIYYSIVFIILTSQGPQARLFFRHLKWDSMEPWMLKRQLSNWPGNSNDLSVASIDCITCECCHSIFIATYHASYWLGLFIFMPEDNNRKERLELASSLCLWLLLHDSHVTFISVLCLIHWTRSQYRYAKYLCSFLLLWWRVQLFSIVCFSDVCLISLNQRLGCFDPNMVPGSEPDLIIKSARKFMSAIKDCETGSKLWKIYPTKTFKQLQQSMDKLTKYGK